MIVVTRGQRARDRVLRHGRELDRHNRPLGVHTKWWWWHYWRLLGWTFAAGFYGAMDNDGGALYSYDPRLHPKRS